MVCSGPLTEFLGFRGRHVTPCDLRLDHGLEVPVCRPNEGVMEPRGVESSMMSIDPGRLLFRSVKVPLMSPPGEMLGTHQDSIISGSILPHTLLPLSDSGFDRFSRWLHHRYFFLGTAHFVWTTHSIVPAFPV